ncbi:MAG: hypothetical protein WBB28_24905 [Crinalium sp.]
MQPTDLIYKSHCIWVEPNSGGEGFIPNWRNPDDKCGCCSRSINSFPSIESAIRFARVRIDATTKAQEKLQEEPKTLREILGKKWK